MEVRLIQRSSFIQSFEVQQHSDKYRMSNQKLHTNVFMFHNGAKLVLLDIEVPTSGSFCALEHKIQFKKFHFYLRTATVEKN